MKKLLILISFYLIPMILKSQTPNVTIEGTYSAGTDAPLFIIKNTTTQAASVYSTLPFMNASRYTAAIKTIGVSGASATLSFYTYSGTTLSGLRERLSILDNGKMILKDNANYTLTDAPNTIFDIIGGSSGNITQFLTLRSAYSADNTGSGISLINSTSTSSSVGSQIISQTITAGNGKSDLIFKSHGGGGAYGALLERLRITGYGSVILNSNNNDASISLSGSTSGAGNNFSLISNNALTGGTNLNGGFLTVSGGASTGTGYSKIIFKVAKVGTSGTGTNTPVEVFAIGGTTNNIAITDASFNLYHASPTPNDGMSSQVVGASVAAFALWGQSVCPTSSGTGYGNANSNVAVSGQMESDVQYSFGLHAMMTPCTSTMPNNSAGVYGTYTNSSSTMQASGALGYKDGGGKFFGIYGTCYNNSGYYAGGFDYDVLFPATSSDWYMRPSSANYGYIGTSSYYYYYMYSNNFIDPSSKTIKRNITQVKNEILNYIMNDIDNITPSLYKYIFETDEIIKGKETKYRPNLHLGIILEDAPDYIQDNDFSGIDIYALSTLSLVGVKHNRTEIQQLRDEIEYLKKIIIILCEQHNITNNINPFTNTIKHVTDQPINGLKVNDKIKILRIDESNNLNLIKK